MARLLNEFDTFKLLLQESIDNIDNQVVLMLYQPIIGPTATCLYFTLLQEKQLTNRINLDFNHKRLMLLLNIDKVDLLNAFRQLELYDLVISYYYSTKSTYIYDLKKPLSADLFFQNHKLSSNLSEKLGNLQYERQRYYFLKNEPVLTNDFVNISTNLANEENLKPINSLQSILSSLSNNETPLTNFNNKFIKKNNSPQLHANLNQETTININQNKMLFNSTLSQMQLQNPEEYVFSLTKKPINDKLKATLQLLINDYKLSIGVINCLLEYTSFKNNKRIEPNYILKIAKTFQENNINDTTEALNHLKRAYSKSKKGSYTTSNYKQNVLWTKDDFNIEFTNESLIEKNNQNPIKSGTMTQEEIKKILKEIDDF